MRPVKLRPLVAYLEKRGIPLEVAKPYVKEAFFHVPGRQRDLRDLFALAFANDSGTYELRNPGFQGCSGVKDVSCIRRDGSNAGACF